jgi:O-acetyl-ADP-ribose deacetylase
MVARYSLEGRMEVIWGDITSLRVDAVVNAAKSSLEGGGGVDGLIHWTAGSRLLEACRQLGECPMGEARITPGFNLPARFIIHTVGPVYGLDPEPERILADCYRNSLRLAIEEGLRTIAFPAISCGSYRFPVARACPIAIGTVAEILRREALPEKVLFVVYSLEQYEIYRKVLQGVLHGEEKRITL